MWRKLKSSTSLVMLCLHNNKPMDRYSLVAMQKQNVKSQASSSAAAWQYRSETLQFNLSILHPKNVLLEFDQVAGIKKICMEIGLLAHHRCKSQEGDRETLSTHLGINTHFPPTIYHCKQGLTSQDVDCWSKQANWCLSPASESLLLRETTIETSE